MFFYTSLLVGSLVAAIVGLWVFRTVRYNVGSVYKTVLPGTAGAAGDPTSHLKARETPITSSDTPWGWQGHETPANAAKTHAALPTEKSNWGWSGSRNEVREQQAPNGPYDNLSKRANTRKAGAGWPHREEKTEFAGKAYKVTRKTSPEPSDSNTADKSWGW